MKKEPNEGGLDILPLLTRPNTVAIVALGSSSQSFVRYVMSENTMKKPFDEVWTCNRGFRGFQHDKLFVMDDLRWLKKNRPQYAKFLQVHDGPIITSTPYPEFPNSISYPINEVMETIGDDIFACNTVAYMVAYAIHIRAKNVHIYGADFSYPNGSTAESGGQAVAYLCGMMRHFDMVHSIPGDSTLLYANKVKVNPLTGGQQRDFYGYHRITEMNKEKSKDAARRKAQKATLKKRKS